MIPVFCTNCQSLIAPDGDGRMPPWCPCCGADINRRTPEAASEAQPRQPEPEPEDKPLVALPAEPPMLIPADPAYAPTGGHRPFTEGEHEAKPGSSPAARVAAAVCTAIGVGLALVIAPRVFPQLDGGFSVPQMVLAAVLGGIGGAVGWLVGQVIDATRS